MDGCLLVTQWRKMVTPSVRVIFLRHGHSDSVAPGHNRVCSLLPTTLSRNDASRNGSRARKYGTEGPDRGLTKLVQNGRYL